jgi:hypothetical protein
MMLSHAAFDFTPKTTVVGVEELQNPSLMTLSRDLEMLLLGKPKLQMVLSLL